MSSPMITNEEVMRKLSIMYEDASSTIKRSDVRLHLLSIEKRVNSSNPDFIVIKGCTRYMMFELDRKEWKKYYFDNVVSSASGKRSDVILSRYPIRASQLIEPVDSELERESGVILTDIQIAFNDLPKQFSLDLDSDGAESYIAENVMIVLGKSVNENNKAVQILNGYQGLCIVFTDDRLTFNEEFYHETCGQGERNERNERNEYDENGTGNGFGCWWKMTNCESDLWTFEDYNDRTKCFTFSLLEVE